MMDAISQVLDAIERGDPHAAEQLLPLVYEELRRLAAQRLADEKPGHTLQPTALVHEAYLRLVGAERVSHWNDRTHFFRAAAEAMRRILVDRARAKLSQKRGGAWRQVDLDGLAQIEHDPSCDLVAVNEALEQFREHDPMKAELVKLRYFAGLSVQDAADVLGISRATADRYWRYAKTWLYCALTRTDKSDGK
jgi:RNA polymerase sigma factor (TIGR02999 family)